MAKVVIVGAGPAGAATALLLARNGIGVELVERSDNFARVFRGEGMMPTGLAALHAMGLGDEMNALDWRPIERWDLHLNRQFVMSVAEPSASAGDLGLRAIRQSALLELIIDRACGYPNFRFRDATTVRDILRKDGRVCGVRAHSRDGDIDVPADLLIGCDGRGSVIRACAALELMQFPQAYDIAWFKTPVPERLREQYPMMLCAAGSDAAAAYVSWDGQLQIAAAFPKGAWQEIRKENWVDACVRALPEWLEDHIRGCASEIDVPIPLDVIVGRCPQWHRPGVLLLGDAAHPMSPIRAQGINLALRDAIVTANYLVPALKNELDVGAALQAIQEEREPEIVRCQSLQLQDARGQDLARRRPWLVSAIIAVARPILRLLAPTGLPQRAWLHAQRELRYGVTQVELGEGI